jgi:hypothetical protein
LRLLFDRVWIRVLAIIEKERFLAIVRDRAGFLTTWKLDMLELFLLQPDGCIEQTDSMSRSSEMISLRHYGHFASQQKAYFPERTGGPLTSFHFSGERSRFRAQGTHPGLIRTQCHFNLDCYQRFLHKDLSWTSDGHPE